MKIHIFKITQREWLEPEVCQFFYNVNQEKLTENFRELVFPKIPEMEFQSNSGFLLNGSYCWVLTA